MPVAKIYPPISYPVSRGTRMIGSLIKWDHSQDWFVSINIISKESIPKFLASKIKILFFAGRRVRY